MIVPDKDLRKTADNTIYAQRMDSGTLRQFNDCLSQRGVMYGALMPDAHVGYSAPIGSALVTQGRIFPEWVGVDIGCGILSTPTSFNVDDIRRNARGIFRDMVWKSSINNKTISPVAMPRFLDTHDLSDLGHKVFKDKDCFGYQQLGTLGGGNHFVEIGADLNGMVWISIHSGSRGTGHRIASSHIKYAKDGHVGVPEDHPCFFIGTVAAEAYLKDMAWLLRYASISRHRILSSVIGVINEYCDGKDYPTGEVESSHNHIEVTNNQYIHRKGCTQADKGEMVNIASNMRDGIYLCRGHGEYDSAYSCSHGAGRFCSRASARKLLSALDFKKDMKDVVCASSIKYLDEAPRAYKDIGTVLSLQTDLVEVVNHITPIINLKG